MPLVLDQSSRRLNRAPYAIAQVERFAAQFQGTAGYPGNIEQVIDQARYMPDLPLQDVAHPGDTRIIDADVIQDLGSVDDRRSGLRSSCRAWRGIRPCAGPLRSGRSARRLGASMSAMEPIEGTPPLPRHRLWWL